MEILGLSDPTNKTMSQHPKACPGGFTCTADSWVVTEAPDGRGTKSVFKYGGYDGGWVAVEDQAPHGWSVYWDARVGGGGDNHRSFEGTEIELVVDAILVGHSNS
jgi:hypothetical protein